MRHLTFTVLSICLLGLGSLAQAGTEILIYNPGDEPVDVTLTCHTPAREDAIGVITIPAHGTGSMDPNLLVDIEGTAYSATISAATPITAVAMGMDSVEEGANEAVGAYLAFSEGSTTLTTARVENNVDGRTTEISLTNPNEVESTCESIIVDENGEPEFSFVYKVPPYKPVTLSAGDFNLADGFTGSATVTSEDTLIGIKYYKRDGGETVELTSLQSPTTDSVLLPVVYNQEGGKQTTIRQFNVGDTAISHPEVIVKDQDGNTVGTYSTDSIPPNGTRLYDPEDVFGDLNSDEGHSARVVANGQPQAVEARTTYSDGSAWTYTPNQPATTVHVPGIQSPEPSGSDNDYTTVTVLNANSEGASYNLQVFDPEGALLEDLNTYLEARSSQTFNTYYWRVDEVTSSATVTSDQPLSVQVSSQKDGNAYSYSGASGTNGGSRSAATTLYLPYLINESPDVAPDYTGWWWEGEDYTGTGISIENQGTNVYLAWYGYDAQGRPEWYSALMGPAGNDYVGDLVRYTGWPLAGNDPGAGYTATLMGSMTLDFASSNEATLEISLNGVQRTKTLTRYWTGTTDTRQINGWWYAPSHDGMGVFLEVRDGVLFGAWYHYRDDQSPRWWICLGDFTEGSTVYTGPWGEYSSGQTLTGEYQASVLEGTQGDMSLNFADESHATMTWGGNTYNLERFSFGDITLR